MPNIFDSLAKWLSEQALYEEELSRTIRALGARLIQGGIPVSRISIGQSVLHPLIGVLNHRWDKDEEQIYISSVPRSDINKAFFAATPSPFGDFTVGHSTETTGQSRSIVANLKDPETRARYPLFEELAAAGVAGYAAFNRRFGFRGMMIPDLAHEFAGASVAFTTRRSTGFTDQEIEGLESLMTPLCVCIQTMSQRVLTNELLETYLGRLSGRHVLSGQSARGDGEAIDCVLLYSDMRDSLSLSQTQPLDAYLATLNDYFDLIVQPVEEHGGEILKLIGDGVLAIFPVDAEDRPRDNMCAAALSAARETRVCRDALNAKRRAEGLPEIDFGLALHYGAVIYGNVGAPKRLDFTATGPAVGLVSRCEAMTRELDHPILATASFAERCPEPARALGTFELKGVPGKTLLFHFDAKHE